LPSSENYVNRNQNWYRGSVLTGKRNKVILGLMVCQGLSSRELSNLNEKDLKLREGKIYVAGSRRSNERELKLEAHQMLELMEYSLKIRPELLKLSGKQSDKFFVSHGSSDRFTNIMQKLVKKLHGQNPKVKSAKQVRASVITYWLKVYNLREVQHMAGHRFVSSTEAYQINDLDGLTEDIGKFHPIG
jgi:integrase/recombinase XerD